MRYGHLRPSNQLGYKAHYFRSQEIFTETEKELFSTKNSMKKFGFLKEPRRNASICIHWLFFVRIWPECDTDIVSGSE